VVSLSKLVLRRQSERASVGWRVEMALLADVLGFSMLVVSYVAIAVIISKAGYSAWWVLLPIAVPVSTFIYFEFLKVSVLTGGVTFTGLLDDTEAFTAFFLILLFVNWAFLVAFAFSNWPALQQQQQPRPSGTSHTRSTHLSPTAPAPAQVPPNDWWSDATDTPSDIAPTETTLQETIATAVPERTTVFCAWCASERAVSSYLLHHCGAKDRPHVYCTTCGSHLADDASCPTCSIAAVPPTPDAAEAASVVPSTSSIS
jgi:hypothetical protein